MVYGSIQKGLMMDKKIVREALEREHYSIVEEKRYKNHAWRFKLSSGTAVFCEDSGKIWLKGKEKQSLEAFLKPLESEQTNNCVFIVYGHDLTTRDELCEILRSWALKPFTIDSLPTKGRTIIEQLEHYIPQTNYGIVLATPDDIGYLAGHQNEAKYRARQNVVLELGMLFSKLGRSRVAIVLKDCDNFEKPSDIAGVLYIKYHTKINEITEKLKKELNEHGYKII